MNEHSAPGEPIEYCGKGLNVAMFWSSWFMFNLVNNMDGNIYFYKIAQLTAKSISQPNIEIYLNVYNFIFGCDMDQLCNRFRHKFRDAHLLCARDARL